MAKRFPTTRHSAVEALRSSDQDGRVRAYHTVLDCYWKPAYKYIRVRWQESPENAEDLTQGFFAVALEKKYLERYDPSQSRFSAFLRVCIDRYIANQRKYATRQKRSGTTRDVPLDFELAESEISLYPSPRELTMEEFFDREWVRSLVTLAIASLEHECEQRARTVHLSLFRRYDLQEANESDAVSYKSLADEFGLTTTTVTNYLASIRRDFRRILLSHLHEMTANDSEYRHEARRLFGIDI
jgi:RNA polymerase sigma-70 factor (ECF subfamily)